MPNLSEKYTLEQLDAIIHHITELSNRNYKVRIPVSENGDTIDTLSMNLNKLAQELENYCANTESDRTRFNNLTDILLRYSVCDFSEKAALSEAGDEIDAISAGLNALGEELNFALQSLEEYTENLETSNRTLERNTKKMQLIFDNTPNAIITSDVNSKITEWNQAAEKMYGYKKSEIIGKSIEEIIRSEYVFPETSAKAESELMKSGIWSGQLVQHTSRKDKRIVFSTISLLKDENGIHTGFLSVNNDLTKSIKTSEDLKAIETRYHLLVNEIVDYAIIMLDPKGYIISWNKGAEKIQGYPENEILNQHFSILYTEQDLNDNLPQQIIEQVKQTGRAHSKGWRIRKDKSLFWADVTITELVNDQGRLQGFVKITRDLTEQLRAEEEIKQKSEELKRSNAELEQFAYVASHDLQEPLRAITSYVQLLEKNYKDKLDQDAHDFIHFVVDGTNRMQTLIYSLLEFSRINRVKPFENIDLDDTLTEVVKDLDASINASGAKIIWEKLPNIYGDKILIGQLLMNLIANAIKFHSDEPPVIKITCKKKANEFLFCVSDNGIGIKKDYAEKIFVIFQRLHSKDKYPGTGIGLAICKKIVERHGGSIWVESELGNGSSFYFTIKKK